MSHEEELRRQALEKIDLIDRAYRASDAEVKIIRDIRTRCWDHYTKSVLDKGPIKVQCFGVPFEIVVRPVKD